MPDFRHRALEEKFAENMTTCCDILKAFGHCKVFYDIQRMLNIMKLDGWRKIEPFRFYIDPLLENYTIMRDELRLLGTRGILFCRFPLWHNFDFEEKTIAMIERDITV
jgi:hypothetical protein